MPLDLTEEQILQFAPDDSSIKSGKSLAVISKWVLRECSDRCVWGHCQGSGKNPYQTAIDLNSIAFKCSCPSRKFPCKHGLGLLLLYARRPEQFSQSEEPDWVKEWLSKRAEKAEKKEHKAKKETPVNEEAQAKRRAQRHQTVLDGIADLELWMKDLLRNGFINIPEQPYSVFDGMARRMIDAQATGLASRLKAIQDIDFGNEKWSSELADKMGKLYLLMQGYKNIENLSEDWREEIRTQIGYTQAKDNVLAGESIHDKWLVLQKQTLTINDLNTKIHWFYGKDSKRFAIHMEFLAKGTISEQEWIPGYAYDGTLCFYKGVGLCRRALFKETNISQDTFIPDFCTDFKEAAEIYRKAITENPFSENIPMLIKDVTFAKNGNQYYLSDINENTVPVKVEEEVAIDILSITGGGSFNVSVLANADCWEIMSTWYNDKFHAWK